MKNPEYLAQEPVWELSSEIRIQFSDRLLDKTAGELRVNSDSMGWILMTGLSDDSG